MNNENLKPWKPGQSGNPLGRPRRIYSVLKDSGYSREDIADAFAEVGWQTIDDLQAILDDDSKPAILKVIARAFIKGAEKGDFRYVSEILAHCIGVPGKKADAPPDEIHLTLDLGTLPPPPKPVHYITPKDIEDAQIVEPPQIESQPEPQKKKVGG